MTVTRYENIVERSRRDKLEEITVEGDIPCRYDCNFLRRGTFARNTLRFNVRPIKREKAERGKEKQREGDWGEGERI